MDIGERIRQKRKAAGLTQADLAKMLKTTENTIYRWECSMRTPTGLYRKAVEDWLGGLDWWDACRADLPPKERKKLDAILRKVKESREKEASDGA